jgi:hypothetical protein
MVGGACMNDCCYPNLNTTSSLLFIAMTQNSSSRLKQVQKVPPKKQPTTGHSSHSAAKGKLKFDPEKAQFVID